MSAYLVHWWILINADSPEEAVLTARNVQKSEDNSIASIFQVKDEEGNEKEIDVLLLDN